MFGCSAAGVRVNFTHEELITVGRALLDQFVTLLRLRKDFVGSLEEIAVAGTRLQRNLTYNCPISLRQSFGKYYVNACLPPLMHRSHPTSYSSRMPRHLDTYGT